MADVSIDATALTAIARAQRGIHFTTDQIGYHFLIDSNGAFVYSKTTDGGGTWGSPVTVNSSAGHIAYCTIWDRDVPGDTGTLIHAAYFDSTTDDVHYRTLDTNGDTLGTERVVFTGSTAQTANANFVSITKTRSGYLYCGYTIDAAAEAGFNRSTDGGATWGADLGGGFHELSTDKFYLFPATGTGDDNDCWAIYNDGTANSLTMKMWDSSAGAQVESASMQTVIEPTADLNHYGFSGTILSNGDLFIVSMSDRDQATADMQCWRVSAVNSGSLTGITALTNITTDIDDIYYPYAYRDDADAIYVAYAGKRDGSQDLGNTASVNYTKSTDGGATWSSGDTAYMEASPTSIQQVWTPLTGPRFYASWRQAATLNGNKVNSVVYSPAVANSGFFGFM